MQFASLGWWRHGRPLVFAGFRLVFRWTRQASPWTWTPWPRLQWRNTWMECLPAPLRACPRPPWPRSFGISSHACLPCPASRCARPPSARPPACKILTVPACVLRWRGQVEFEGLSFSAHVPLRETGIPTVGKKLLSLVTPRKAKTKAKTILSGCSGVLQPGQLTLVRQP